MRIFVIAAINSLMIHSTGILLPYFRIWQQNTIKLK